MAVTDETTQRFVPLDYVERAPDEMTARAAEFYSLMRRRRTVRDFSGRPVPDGVIEHALLTAGSAPSGAHRQPWHFVVVTDPAKKAAIREAAEKEERAFYGQRASKEWLEALEPLGTDPDKPFLTTAPVLIAVFLRRFTFVPGETGRVGTAPQELLHGGVGGHRHRAPDRCVAQRRVGDPHAHAKPDGFPQRVARARSGRAGVRPRCGGLSGRGRASAGPQTLYARRTCDVCLMRGVRHMPEHAVIEAIPVNA